MDVAGCVGRAYHVFGTEDDASGVDAGVDEEGRDAGHPFAVDDCPVDWSCAPVLRQQGGVEVECPLLRHLPDRFRQHPEADDNEDVALQGRKGLQELRILQLLGLEDGEAFLHGEALHGAFRDLQAAAARLVRHRDHSDDFVFSVEEGLERGNGELRSAHVDYPGLPEEGQDLALDFPPELRGGLVAEYGFFTDGAPGEEYTDGQKDHRGNEGADEGAGRAVVGQLRPRDVDHPVEDEEQSRDYGG